jgi:hypothetical protein
MNALIEAPSRKAQIGNAHHNSIEVVQRTLRFSLNHGCLTPLWQKARTQTIGFRRDEFERTHWKKVWRLIFVD